MAWTLFDLVYRVLREVGPTHEGVATSGSTTTIVDTVRLTNRYSDDWFNGGAAFILYDAAGLGAAPQGEMGRISDFVNSSGTATLSAALTTAVAAGDRYALGNNHYNLDRLISAINAVLARIPIATEDKATLDTASGQYEYTLPAGVLDENIEVFMQTKTGDTDANLPVQLHNWFISETGTASQKLLIFHAQPIASRDLWIKYYTPHPPLYASSDKLRESVGINQVVYNAAAQILRQDLSFLSVEDKTLAGRLRDMEEIARAWTPASTRQSHKLATWGISDVYADDDWGL